MENLFNRDLFVPLKNAGRHANCQRCGIKCVVADQANLAARPIRRADGEGYCVTCALTQWLRSDDMDITRLLPAGTDPREALRLPHIQELVARIFKVGKADASADEINWQRLVENWSLPVAQTRKKTKIV